MENKQEILTAICETLRLTRNAGTGNALKEIRYVKDDYGEYMRFRFLKTETANLTNTVHMVITQ